MSKWDGVQGGVNGCACLRANIWLVVQCASTPLGTDVRLCHYVQACSADCARLRVTHVSEVLYKEWTLRYPYALVREEEKVRR